MFLTRLPFLGSGFVPAAGMPAGLPQFATYQPFTPVTETLRGLLTGARRRERRRRHRLERRDHPRLLSLGQAPLQPTRHPLIYHAQGLVGQHLSTVGSACASDARRSTAGARLADRSGRQSQTRPAASTADHHRRTHHRDAARRRRACRPLEHARRGHRRTAPGEALCWTAGVPRSVAIPPRSPARSISRSPMSRPSRPGTRSRKPACRLRAHHPGLARAISRQRRPLDHQRAHQQVHLSAASTTGRPRHGSGDQGDGAGVLQYPSGAPRRSGKWRRSSLTNGGMLPRVWPSLFAGSVGSDPHTTRRCLRATAAESASGSSSAHSGHKSDLDAIAPRLDTRPGRRWLAAEGSRQRGAMIRWPHRRGWSPTPRLAFMLGWHRCSRPRSPRLIKSATKVWSDA